MLNKQTEAQKKNEPRGGLNPSKFNLDIKFIREEQAQNINEASTTISEENKKNEKKPIIPENPEILSKTEVNPKNEDKKEIENEQKKIHLPPKNSYGVNQPNEHNINYLREKYFYILAQKGLNSIMNPNNVNHYLLPFINPPQYPFFLNFNNNNNFINNINPLYNSPYFHNFQNPLINCFPNGNLINNHINHINNPERYTITLKSKTNDPTIEKISKITVTTSYIDNSAKKENNNNKETVKKNININNIISGKEARTVVRLNPIPKKHTILDIIKLLELNLKPERNKKIYKALYVPFTKGKEKNLGYCFVMMASPRHVIDIYNAFNGKVIGRKKSLNPIKVIWADKQGNEFLNLNADDVSRKPIIFKDCFVD